MGKQSIFEKGNYKSIQFILNTHNFRVEVPGVGLVIQRHSNVLQGAIDIQNVCLVLQSCLHLHLQVDSDLIPELGYFLRNRGEKRGEKLTPDTVVFISRSRDLIAWPCALITSCSALKVIFITWLHYAALQCRTLQYCLCCVILSGS